MMSANSAPRLNLDGLCLEIPSDSCSPSPNLFSTPGAEWRACLNQMAIAAFLPWLQTEHCPQARTSLNTATLPNVWEFVNGTAVDCGGKRMVLIPSEALDAEELRVPQEWVDLPTWAADYYIAIQVNSDEGWIQVCGYTTHARLKATGEYDAGDRAYTLTHDQLIADLNILWLAQDFCPNEALRTELTPIPALSIEHANSLITRLGNPALRLPRLEIPFSLWGGILEHSGWRQRLYEQRQGIVEQWSVTQWLRSGVSTLAAQIGWGQANLQLAPVTAMRSLPIKSIVRSLNIAGAAYELRIFPVSEVRGIEAPAWRFELRRCDETPIPVGFTLRLLTEDLQPFENNQDSATETAESLYVDVLLEPGEGLVWQVDPTPERYNCEILRF